MATLVIDDTLLVAFADGELDPLTAQLVEEQIATDPALQARLVIFRRTAELLREALSTPDQLRVPPALAAKVADMVTKPSPRSNPSRLAPRAWIPLAAAPAIAGFVLGGTNIIGRLSMTYGWNHAAVAHVLDEVADYHGVFAGEREHLVEVPASRRDHLETWLGARVELAFKVPDLRDHDLEFQGGRLLAIDRRPVAQLMYTGRDGIPVAVCIALTKGDTSSPLLQRGDGDLTLFGQGAGRHVFIVVGPASNRSLRAVAEAIPSRLTRS